MLQVRQADFLDDRSELFQLLDAFMHQLRNAWVEACAEIFFRHTDTQALERGIEAGGVVWNRFVDAGRVLRVEAGHALQQQRAVFGRACHRARLIEAGGVGNHAPARYAAVGRLEACEVGQCRRLANRAAGVGAGRGRQQACSNGGCRPPRRTARDALQVPRVLHRTVVAGFVGRPHGEFVHVGLAQRHCTCRCQARNDRGVVRCLEIVEHQRAATGADALSAEQVLVGQRGT